MDNFVVYLASPIDRADGEKKRELQELRDDCRVSLDNFGFSFFDPHAAWYVPQKVRQSYHPLSPAIAAGDFAVIDNCDAILAILPDCHPSIGVPMEIERGIGRGIPVVVVGDHAAHRSPLLRDRVPVYNRNQVDLAVRHLRSKVDRRLLSTAEMPELKVTGPGRTPTNSHSDDCGLDLYTYIDPEIGRTQASINRHAADPNFELVFREDKVRCNPENFDKAFYRVAPGEFVDLDCGVSVELPPGVWGLITGRSSSIRKMGLLVVNGIIDTGYRGRLFMPVQNVGKTVQLIAHGDRIGQLILMPNATLGVQVRSVDFLSPSERGEKGRGSTGR